MIIVSLIGNAAVENVKTREEAVKVHDFWVKTIIDNPPLMLKDIRTGEVIMIPPLAS